MQQRGLLRFVWEDFLLQLPPSAIFWASSFENTPSGCFSASITRSSVAVMSSLIRGQRINAAARSSCGFVWEDFLLLQLPPVLREQRGAEESRRPPESRTHPGTAFSRIS